MSLSQGLCHTVSHIHPPLFKYLRLTTNNPNPTHPFPPYSVSQLFSNRTCAFREMATKSAQGKREVSSSIQVEEEEEEEEALSLCDLPVNLIKEEDQSKKADSQVIETHEEEFYFRSWGGPFSKESEMCTADEVFFQGQILPLRLSFASNITNGLQRDGRKLNRCESMDHSFLSEFTSNSSRSSSLRSHNSSSSTSSTTITTPKNSKPRGQNRFHMHPSPKPQLRLSVPRQASFGNLGRKSSAWDFFRLGVVPAPEIELQDLKVRSTNCANKNSINRNSSSNSSSYSTCKGNISTKSAKLSNSTHCSDKSNHGLKQFVGKGGGLLSGCKCSTETEPSNIVIINSGTKSTNKTESATHAIKEKVLELKKQRQKQGKKAMSRLRTFEWLKELSHASHPDEEALLSGS